MKVALCLLFAALSGCATCREHPIACGVSVIAVGAVSAYELRHRESSSSPVGPYATIQPVICTGSSCR